MSRRSLFTTKEVLEMKKEIRTGESIKSIARRLAPQFDVTEQQLCSKLYSVATRTYLRRGRPTLEQTSPRKYTKKATTVTRNTKEVVSTSGKKVIMYEDHIRIYF